MLLLQISQMAARLFIGIGCNMKKLLIFDKVTKQIIAHHHFWEDSFTVNDNWKTFDAANQDSLIVDTSVKEFDQNGAQIIPDGNGGYGYEILA